jgi:hypothetical protein
MSGIQKEPVPPGCPDFACSTIDAERMRILSAALFINALSFIKIYQILLFFTIEK